MVGGRPATPPWLSLAELDRAIVAFVVSIYNARPHSEIGEAPREKVRVGARVTKRWHPPATPAERALASERIDAESIARIAELRGRADPVIALAAIRAAQAELGECVDQRGVAPATRGSRSSSISLPALQTPRGAVSGERSIAGPTGG